MVVCPSCKSSRIRNDYKPAPLWLRIIGVRALLCDYCNFQFRAFCLRSPKSGKPRQVKPKADVFNEAAKVDLSQLRSNIAEEQQEKAGKLRRMELSIRHSTESEEVAGHVIPVQNDLRTQVLKLHAQGAKEPVSAAAPAVREQISAAAAQPPCPQCASRNVRRRQRTALERAALALSDYRAFHCQDCATSFYAKPDKDAFKIKLADAALFDSTALNADGKG
ncbi:MAG: hypothetical protein SF339_08715 [Blastocatellia bacterium]|nr:hypothetical protein [Blastocatellia bacterium]